MTKLKDERYSEKEASARLIAALKGARIAGPSKPKKDKTATDKRA